MIQLLTEKLLDVKDLFSGAEQDLDPLVERITKQVVVQMAVWIYFPAWWVLPAGGFAVGYITNFLALRLVFEPHHPINFGFFKLQALDAQSFEGVLRPAFQEDEWKLFVTGAVLGTVAGVLQLVYLFGGSLG